MRLERKLLRFPPRLKNIDATGQGLWAVDKIERQDATPRFPEEKSPGTGLLVLQSNPPA